MLNQNVTSRRLVANYDVALPSEATILSVGIIVVRKCSGPIYCCDNEVMLRTNNTESTNNNDPCVPPNYWPEGTFLCDLMNTHKL
jgi:hypothetical protein